MKLGIVGCGLIGRKRAAAVRGHEIALVSDLNEVRARNLSAGTGAGVAKNWQELVAANLDAVIIAVTHDLLARIAVAAIKSGKHVLVEKPAGRTAGEVGEVVAAARAHRRIVKVGFNHRFHPAVIKAKALVDAGELGPLMFIRGRYGHGGRPGMEEEWRCNPEISGGGELADQAPHLIDLSRWFLGDLDVAFAAAPTLFWNISVDDNCFLSLKAAGGQIAWLHASWTEWKNLFSFEIYGRQGKLSIEGLGGSYGIEKLTWYKMLPGMGPPETISWEYPFPDRSWEAEFDEFVSSIAEDRAPLGNIEDALAVHLIVDKAYGRSK